MTFRRVQRELSADEIARLRALSAAGKRLKELAHQFGISHQTVSRYLRDPNQSTKPAARTIAAMRAARRGELVTVGGPDALLAHLKRRDRRVGLAENLPEEWVEAVRNAKVPVELPVLHLGDPLHRRDIDARAKDSESDPLNPDETR